MMAMLYRPQYVKSGHKGLIRTSHTQVIKINRLDIYKKLHRKYSRIKSELATFVKLKEIEFSQITLQYNDLDKYTHVFFKHTFYDQEEYLLSTYA